MTNFKLFFVEFEVNFEFILFCTNVFILVIGNRKNENLRKILKFMLLCFCLYLILIFLFVPLGLERTLKRHYFERKNKNK